MHRLPLVLAATFGACAQLRAQQPAPVEPPKGAVDLSADQHRNLGEAMGTDRFRLDDWIDRFDVSGFVAARYFDTATGGSRPDGAVGIQAASLFFDITAAEHYSAFLELRLDYFPEAGGNEVDLGEAYIEARDVLALTDEAALAVRVGRFDLPFGEYYELEDPDDNRLIGFPAAIPYRWDEGVQAFADFDSFGFHVAVTDGTYSRNSSSGVGPAATVRLHARPSEGLYVSASGLYIHEADASALCFGGSVITPVAGGAAGTSPSQTVRSALGSLDLVWQVAEPFHLQASFGGGEIDDEVDAFDRTILWWMFEPTLTFAPGWSTTLRWSGAGTFDSMEGYRFEGRPYGNGSASYGYDLSQLQRVQLGVRREFTKDLVGKVEVGFDHLVGTDPSGLPNDTRLFTALELVLSF